jgi:L-aspartate oxidase
MKMTRFDFIIVGSGAGGLSAALHASRYGTVAVVTKRGALDSNSNWAQGGIACVTSDEDSIEQHVQDTLIAGAGLCNEAAVRTIVTEGPARIDELVNWGVDFDQREAKDGHLEFDLTREGGHSQRRVLHAADATGREISEKLLAAVRAEPNVTLLENHFAIDLITTSKLGYVSEDRVLGL